MCSVINVNTCFNYLLLHFRFSLMGASSLVDVNHNAAPQVDKLKCLLLLLCVGIFVSNYESRLIVPLLF